MILSNRSHSIVENLLYRRNICNNETIFLSQKQQIFFFIKMKNIYILGN